MIDQDAVFDAEGIADLGDGATLLRKDGQYILQGVDGMPLVQNGLYNFGRAIIRLSEAP